MRAGVVGIAVALLASIIRHYQLRAATNAYIAELKANGEPMDLAQVMPLRVPADKNSAETLREAAALFKADSSLLTSNVYCSMRMVAPGKAMVCSQQPDARDYNVTNSWDEVVAAVSQNKESFGLLHQVIEKPVLDFQIHYEGGAADLGFTNMCLSEVKEAALRLQVAVLSDLHRGENASAGRDLRAMLAIVKGMREERLVITELVRIAIAQIALRANWEILQNPNVTDGQLARLQDDWASIEFIRAGEKALELDRVVDEITLQKWRHSDADLWRSFYFYKESGLLPKAVALESIQFESQVFRWQFWWSYPDELRTLKGYQATLDAWRFVTTNSSFVLAQRQLTNAVAKLMIPTNSDGLFFDFNHLDMRSMFSPSVLSMEKYLYRAIEAETAKASVTGAIALKRYQLKHGEYPATLAALVPEFVSKVPHDPMDGQPLRYRSNQDGTFLLYSIGDDGKDDGGDPTPTGKFKGWQAGRDWVWPQPASAEEIQKFYDNPPK